MSWRYSFSCVLLLFIVILLTLKNYEVWTHPIETLPENRAVEKSGKKPDVPMVMMESPKETNPLAPSILIAQKNIFHPERKDFPIKIEQTKPVVRPQVILYGVTIAGDYQSATVVNPGRPLQKQERETLTIKIGEKIGEYKLAKVFSDRITLENTGDNFEVLLYDPKMPKKRTDVKPEIKPATVTSTQTSPTSPTLGVTTPTPPPVSVEATKPSPPREAVAPPPPATRRPSFPPPESRRGRRPFYPPSGAPAQESAGK